MTTLAEKLEALADEDERGKISWSTPAMTFVCSLHGAEPLFEKSAGYSRLQHMPLHVHRCGVCGAESAPAIHADLGG